MSLRLTAKGFFSAAKAPRAGHTENEVTHMEKANLTVLLESDAQALEYYLALPADVRCIISRDPEGIGTFADLRRRASQAARSL